MAITYNKDKKRWYKDNDIIPLGNRITNADGSVRQLNSDGTVTVIYDQKNNVDNRTNIEKKYYNVINSYGGTPLLHSQKIKEFSRNLKKNKEVTQKLNQLPKESKSWIHNATAKYQNNKPNKKEQEILSNFVSVNNLKSKSNTDLGNMWNMFITGRVSDLIDTIQNGLERKRDKKSLVETKSVIKIPTKNSQKLPDIIIGDTIPYPTNNRRYIIPENINVKSLNLGIRNRGDYTPIKTQAGLITTFHSFVPYNQRNKYAKSFIGVTPKGEIIVGDSTKFTSNDMVSNTYSNIIKQFKTNNNQLQYKDDPENRPRLRPIVITSDNTLGSLNLNTDINGRGDKYGMVSGGRVLVQVGNELRLLSGSIEDINKSFEDMKKRNHADRGTFYALDNGSYNSGLRTYDGVINSRDLKKYDNLNTSGGNFLYIK